MLAAAVAESTDWAKRLSYIRSLPRSVQSELTLIGPILLTVVGPSSLTFVSPSFLTPVGPVVTR